MVVEIPVDHPVHILANDGSVYNLTDLGTISGSDSNDTSFRWVYSANLCDPLPMTCDVCGTSSAYCQVSPSGSTSFCVGSRNNITWTGLPHGRGVVATVLSPPDIGGTVRQGTIVVFCDPLAKSPQVVQIYNPSSPTTYHITLNSVWGCSRNLNNGLPELPQNLFNFLG